MFNLSRSIRRTAQICLKENNALAVVRLRAARHGQMWMPLPRAAFAACAGTGGLRWPTTGQIRRLAGRTWSATPGSGHTNIDPTLPRSPPPRHGRGTAVNKSTRPLSSPTPRAGVTAAGRERPRRGRCSEWPVDGGGKAVCQWLQQYLN